MLISIYFQRMLSGRAVLESTAGLESFEVLGGATVDVGARTGSTYESLRKIVEKYLNNDPRLIEVAKKIIQQGGEGLRMLGDDSALQQRPEAVEGLEAIVRMDGSRPSFMVVNGEIDRDSSPIGGLGDPPPL